MKILIWAAQNKQRGRMLPTGRQFDMPDQTAYLSANGEPTLLVQCLY